MNDSAHIVPPCLLTHASAHSIRSPLLVACCHSSSRLSRSTLRAIPALSNTTIRFVFRHPCQPRCRRRRTRPSCARSLPCLRRAKRPPRSQSSAVSVLPSPSVPEDLPPLSPGSPASRRAPCPPASPVPGRTSGYVPTVGGGCPSPLVGVGAPRAGRPQTKRTGADPCVHPWGRPIPIFGHVRGPFRPVRGPYSSSQSGARDWIRSCFRKARRWRRKTTS